MQSGQTGINTLRLYNPVKQGHDQDPEGCFTRKWVPELVAVKPAILQTPWLGLDTESFRYPAPIVDPVISVRLAKDRLTALRRISGYREAALVVFQKHGSRKRRIDDDNPRVGMSPRKIPPKSTAQLSLLFAGQGPQTDLRTGRTKIRRK